MTYEYINGTLVGDDIMQVFVYANNVTHGLAVPFIMLGFFLLVFISSMMMQIRFSSRIRPEVSFAASSFASFGFAIILGQSPGLVNPAVFIISFGMFIVGLVWLILSE